MFLQSRHHFPSNGVANPLVCLNMNDSLFVCKSQHSLALFCQMRQVLFTFSQNHHSSISSNLFACALFCRFLGGISLVHWSFCERWPRCAFSFRARLLSFSAVSTISRIFSIIRNIATSSTAAFPVSLSVATAFSAPKELPLDFQLNDMATQCTDCSEDPKPILGLNHEGPGE